MIHGMLVILLGFILDLLIGDPPWLPHPVRLIGLGISKGEKVIRALFPKTPSGQLWGGCLLVLFITGGTGSLAWAVIVLAGFFHPAAAFFVEVIMAYQVLAVNGLKAESMKVYDQLKDGDLVQARYCLSRIVGRDTDKLDEAEVCRAAVETVAENTGDGVIAPLFFMALGGPVLGMVYKAVNTLDSMIGYKNERYLYFGKPAAKLDDLFNYLPARASAWLMIGSAALLSLDYQGACRVYQRDKHNHASPNSAHPEAACAGALGLKLGGESSYFGKPVSKPTIGDHLRSVEVEDIARANRLLYMTAGLGLGGALLLRAAVLWFWGNGGLSG